jgi:aldose 1-epimerase
MLRKALTLAVLFGLALAPAGAEARPAGPNGMKKTAFGRTRDGKAADLYVLRNANGVEAAVTNYGGVLVSLRAPDRAGRLADVVLGYDTLAGYLADTTYQGALVGRYANRIAGGKFTLDGKTYTLATNNGPNAIHGGLKGFNSVVWAARDVSTREAPALELTYVSRDGEEGYPGTMTARAVYTLTDKNELRVDYTATADKPTIVNLTNHAYFNLTGSPASDVLGHEVTIVADRFTPVNADMIPTGELRPVEGTPFDFRKPAAIGARIGAKDEQLELGRGYDHNYVLGAAPSAEPRLAARAYEPKSGRELEVWTTEPGVQLYTGNWLAPPVKGKGGVVYAPRTGFCLETQHFPDSPNRPEFPSTVLRPGQTFRSTTVYKFSAK